MIWAETTTTKTVWVFFFFLLACFQCDQMPQWFLQNFVIYINENLPNSKKLPKYVEILQKRN